MGRATGVDFDWGVYVSPIDAAAAGWHTKPDALGAPESVVDYVGGWVCDNYCNVGG